MFDFSDRPQVYIIYLFFVDPLSALTDPNAAASQQAMLQQQLSVLAYSPYGDSPLFRNPLSDPKKKEEVSVAVCSSVLGLQKKPKRQK